MNKESKLPDLLEKFYKTGTTYGLSGEKRNITGGIQYDEAQILRKMVRDTDAQYSLETGVANGLSALSMCSAHTEGYNSNNKNHVHYGIDPCQMTDHDGAALWATNEAGFSDRFELLEGPSHLMIPELISKGITLDCAFIDGWHTFDYILIDFFLIDKILKPGGIIAFHDMNLAATQKVINFLLTHRNYSIETKYLEKIKKSIIYKIARFSRIMLSKKYRYYNKELWSTIMNYRVKGIFLLRKENDNEPKWDYFHDF